VAHDDGIVLQIPPEQARVVAAQVEDLHVGEAQARGVDASQKLVGAHRVGVDLHGLAVDAHVLKAAAENLPGQDLVGDGAPAGFVLLESHVRLSFLAQV